MTVQSTDYRAEYTATGGTEFAFPRILDESHLLVYVDGVAQTLNSDYTIAGVGDAAGVTVTFATAPTVGVSVVLLRDVPLTQLTDFVENDIGLSETREAVADKSCMIDQQLSERLDRTLTFPAYSGSSGGILPEPVIGNYLRWSATSPPTLESTTVTPDTGIGLPLSQADGGFGQDMSSASGLVLWTDGTANVISSVVDVAGAATGGTGTSGDPWTGWDTEITWSGSRCYMFRAGYYDPAGTVVLSGNETTIYLAPGAIINQSTTDAVFNVLGTLVASSTLTATTAVGDTTLTLASVANMAADQKVWISHTTNVGQVEVGIIDSVNSGASTITLKRGMQFPWTHTDGVTVYAVTPVENVCLCGQGKILNDTASASNMLTFNWAWHCGVRDLTVRQASGTSRPIMFSTSNGPYGAAYCYADNVRVLGASENGIETYTYSYGTRIHGNHIEAAGTGVIGHGISVRGTGHVVTSNVVASAIYDCISVATGRNIVVTGNTVAGASGTNGTGIHVSSSNIKNVNFGPNIISGCRYGVVVYDGTGSGIDQVTIGPQTLVNVTFPLYVAADADVTVLRGTTPSLFTSAPASVATSGGGEDTLYAKTIDAYSLGPNAVFRISGLLTITGVNDTKQFQIYLYGQECTDYTFAAGDSGAFRFEAVVQFQNAMNSQRTTTTIIGASGVETVAEMDTTTEFGSASAIQITGLCANANDSIALSGLLIEPIAQCF